MFLRSGGQDVAIYLKTAAVLPGEGVTDLCELIHPPIDRVLLKTLAKQTLLKHLNKINWTLADEHTYWNIIKDLRATFGYCNWKTESYWNLTDEE